MGRRLSHAVALVVLTALTVSLSAGLLVAGAGAAQATVTPDATGAALGQALAADPGVGAATLTTRPATGTPDATSTTPLAGFPTDGGSYAVLTTGNAQQLGSPGVLATTVLSATAVAARGTRAYDVSVLRVPVDVPVGANCLTFDFRFLSEEFPVYVGGTYNDAFVAELDRSTWTTNSQLISAPDNFAFDASGKVISINATGLGGMSAANAAGTAYDGSAVLTADFPANVGRPVGGATGLLSASTRVTPGAHTVFFSIFDNGDAQLDSAVLLDNLRTGFVAGPGTNCVAGAQVATYGLDVVGPASVDATVGQSGTTRFRLTDGQTHAPVANAPVAVTISGANPQTTTVTTDAAGLATLTYSGGSAGADQVGACYRPAGADACRAAASATVNWRKAVSVAATSYTVAYGAAQPAPAWTVSGLDGADSLTVEPTCTVASPHTAVGSYPITCSGAAADAKYAVTYVPGTLTVTPAPLTVSADNQTVTYGEDDPQFTATTTGLQGDDALVQAPTCTVSGAHSAVGTHPITCSGADAGSNYQITYAAGTLTVKKATAQVSADNRTITYGDADPAFTATVSGLRPGDTVRREPDCAVAGAHVHAGRYPIVCSGADLGENYTPDYVDGALTVRRAAVVVTADNLTVPYGDPVPEFTWSTGGLVNDDRLVTAPTCSVAGPHTAVGDYPVVCSGADAGDDYTTSTVAGVLTVTRARASVTADNQTITYGDAEPAYTYSAGGTVSGDELDGAVTCGVGGDHAGAGVYPITCTGPADDGRYDIAYLAGTLTVKKAALTLTADNQATTYGQPDPQFTYAVAGLRPGDALTTAPTCTVAGAHTDAGSYPVVCSGAGAGANYTLTGLAGTLTVKPALLTITADNQASVFGLGLPSLTWSVNGLVGDDRLLVTPTCSTANGLLAGLYPVTCSGANAGGNYTVKYVSGSLTVGKAVTVLYMTPLVYGLLHPTATLTRSDTGAGVAGQTVTFAAYGTYVCTATTNSRGVASCSDTYLVVFGQKASATFAGGPNHTASADTAGLLTS